MKIQQNTKIIPINIQNKAVAKEILSLQKKSYSFEAKLINFSDIPPLQDSINSLQECAEIFYGYEDNTYLLGAISYKINKPTIDIHRVMVDPDHFRKGIAKSLLQFIETKVKRIEKIIVCTPEKNKPAINLYKNFGYNIVKKEKIHDCLLICYFEKIL